MSNKPIDPVDIKNAISKGQLEVRDEKIFYTGCQCLADYHYISYVDMMNWWFRHWSKETEKKHE
jgi:hypothetical protein